MHALHAPHSWGGAQELDARGPILSQTLTVGLVRGGSCLSRLLQPLERDLHANSGVLRVPHLFPFVSGS